MTDSGLISLDTRIVESIARGFLAQTEAVQSQVRQLIANYPFAANAAITAGEFAIRDSMSDSDKAFILKCRDKGKLLVEGSKGNVPDEKLYDVVAEAAARCLAFPSKDFSVWGNGTLYVKEDGYRRWFAARGDCTDLDVQTDAPVWKKLQDRSYWEVHGVASVKVKGRKDPVMVDCLVGVNGNQTDGIEKVLSHATRSLIKRLWKKIDTSIPIDSDPDDGVSVTVVENAPAAITHGDTLAKIEKAWSEAHGETPEEYEDSPLGRVKSRLRDQPEKLAAIVDAWGAFQSAGSVDALERLSAEMKRRTEAMSMTDGDLKELRAFYSRRQKELKA